MQCGSEQIIARLFMYVSDNEDVSNFVVNDGMEGTFVLSVVVALNLYLTYCCADWLSSGSSSPHAL